MSRTRKRRGGTCTWCGAVGVVTDDHVPPQSVFAEPRPSDLVKVDACLPCNRSTSLDDEYFKQIISATADPTTSPDAAAGWDAVLRSLRRPEARRMREAFFAHTVELVPSGPESVSVGGLLVRVSRLHSTAAKVVQGLFRHVTGSRLSEGYQAKASWLALGVNRNLAYSEAALWMVNEMARQPPVIIGDGAFAYRVCYFPSDPNLSTWLLTFYRSHVFFGATLKRAGAEREEGLR